MSERPRSGPVYPSLSSRGRSYISGRPVEVRRMVRGKPVESARSVPARPEGPAASAGNKQAAATQRQLQRHRPAAPRRSRSRVLNRQIVSVRKKPAKTLKLPAVSLRTFGLVVSAFGLLTLSAWTMRAYQWPFASSVQGDSTSDTSVSQIEANLDETPTSIAAIAAHKVAPTLPRTIKIDKLQLYARVMHAPPLASGMLKPPANIYDTVWLASSSSPGERGAMVISGHVHGTDNPGIFSRLGNLREGDVITVERGDGETFDYQVLKMVVYDNDKVDSRALMAPIEATKPGLNLLTHTYRYDVATRKYEQRLIVFTSLKQSY